tara:strand:+ start:820 stop:1407 length:588 start_codon:yes stop_codon:yes gene_type:complete
MFWTNNPRILFNNNNYLKFFPNSKMNSLEKLNAIMRLSIYLGITLILVSNNYQYFYIPIIIGVFTYMINKHYLSNIEHFFDSYDKSEINYKCTKPTPNNPFMNANLITDDRNRMPACRPTKKVKESIENSFNTNLYRNVSDVFGKQNGQRQFYTMPSTTIPNDQTKFAKWLYGTGPTCKEKTMFCATPWNGAENE